MSGVSLSSMRNVGIYRTHWTIQKPMYQEEIGESVTFNFAPRNSTQADRAMKTGQGVMDGLLW